MGVPYRCPRTGGLGQGQHLFWRRILQGKIRNSAAEKSESESEGGQKFLPPNPLPFCPPERKSFSKFSVRIFAKKSSDFVQRSEPDRTLFELETEAVGAGNATDSQVGVVVEFG